jgi:NitT/TauT family transport system substrate-binding protein
MSYNKRILLGLFSWVVVISAMHLYLNLNWSSIVNERLPPEKRKLNVAFIPVT